MVSATPRTTGSIGTPAVEYWGVSSSASAQKCGGVQSSTIKNRIARPEPQGPVRGRPARERRDRSRGAADDDVLRRRALQPDGVDEHVEEAAGERQRRSQQVVEHGQGRERERRQREPEGDRTRWSDPPGGDRPRRRAWPHQLIDVAVEHVVEGAGAPARERAADDERRERRSAGDPPAAATIAQTEVSTSSDMIRGLVSVK